MFFRLVFMDFIRKDCEIIHFETIYVQGSEGR